MLDATRHEPEAFDVALDSDGFLPVEDFVYGYNLVAQGPDVDEEQVRDVLTDGGSRYFDMDDEEQPQKFRALSGHTTDTFDYPMEEPPLSVVFYYLIPSSDEEHVMEHGLSSPRSKYIPLETTEQDALDTKGKRRIGQPVLLQIDSCAPDTFYRYCGRWYCQHVDPYYIQIENAYGRGA